MRIFFFILVLITFHVSAQEHSCGSNLRLNKFLESNELANQQRVELEKETQDLIITKSINTSIPVVVHVIHDMGSENISDASIQEALDILNANINGQAANFLNKTPDVFVFRKYN